MVIIAKTWQTQREQTLLEKRCCLKRGCHKPSICKSTVSAKHSETRCACITFSAMSLVLLLAVNTKTFWWPLLNRGSMVHTAGEFHAANTYWKPIPWQGNSVIRKNGPGLSYHVPYSMVNIKTGKRNKENMRVCFMLIHWNAVFLVYSNVY